MTIKRSIPWCLSAYLMVHLIGCTLILDPEACESNSDCNDGQCVSGVCIVETNTIDAGESQNEDAFVADQMIQSDQDISDATLPDVRVDMMATDSMPDQNLDIEPPSCKILSDTTLLREQEIRLTIEVTDPDSSVSGLEVQFNEGTLTLDDDGQYVGIFLLVEGTNRFELSAQTQDKTCTASLSVVVDRTPPRLLEPSPAINGSVKSSNGQVFVTAEVEDQHFVPAVSIYVNDEPYMPAQPVEWEDRTYLFELNLERGIHDVEVIAEDQVGNTLPSTIGRDCAVESCMHAFQVDVDSQPPTIEFEGIAVGQGEVNRIPGRSLRLRGVVLDDEVPVSMARLDVTITPDQGNAEQTFPVRANEEGRFDKIIDVLDAGESSATIGVCATDQASNQGCYSILVEKQLPCVSIEQPIENMVTARAAVNLRIAVCDGVNRIDIKVNESAAIGRPITGRTHEESFGIEDGRNVIKVIAYNDQLEDPPAETQIYVFRDATPPRLEFTKPRPDGNTPICTKRDLEVCVIASDDDLLVHSELSYAKGIASVEVGDQTIPSNEIGNGAICREVSLPAGETEGFSFIARAKNHADVTTTAELQLNVDSQAPTIRFEHPPHDTQFNPWTARTSSGQVRVTGSVDSGLCGLTTLTINDTEVGVNNGNAFDQLFEFSSNIEALLTVTVDDLAGNNMVRAYPFRIDDVPPTLSIENIQTTVLTDEGVQFSASATIQFDVVITDLANESESDLGSGFEANALVINDDIYEVSTENGFANTVEFTLEEGANEIRLEVPDRVGNVGSHRFNVHLDTSPPIIQINTPLAGQAVPIPALVRGTVTDGPDGIGVKHVYVNDREAVIDAENGTWEATNLVFSRDDPTITVYATDRLDNRSNPISLDIALPEFVRLDSAQSGIPDVNARPVAIHSADFDGDELIDILELSDQEGTPSRCLMQKNDGTFHVRSGAACGIPEISNHQCSKVADLNVDGQLDLLYFSATKTQLLFGQGDGTFLDSSIPFPAPDETLVDCELIDIDKDGRLDIVSMAPSSLTVLFAERSNIFTSSDSNLQLDPLKGYEHVKAVDLNEDGFTDLIAYGAKGMTIMEASSVSNGFAEVNIENGDLPFEAPDDVAVQSVEIVDVDQDGAFELVVLMNNPQLFDRDPGDEKTFKFKPKPPEAIRYSGVALSAIRRADINLDAQDDLLFFTQGDGRVSVVSEGNSEWRVIEGNNWGLEDIENASSGVISDIDGDGDEDWIITTDTGIKVVKNNQADLIDDYRFVRLDIRRYQDDPQATVTPSDNYGPHISIEYLDEAALEAQGMNLVQIVNAQRAMLPRQNQPTVVTLGTNAACKAGIHFINRNDGGYRVYGSPMTASDNPITIYTLD